MSKIWKIPSQKWEVHITTIDGKVYVKPKSGLLSVPSHTKQISSPNWFERRKGITFGMKVANAVANVQKICDKWNEAEQQAQKAVESIKE